MGMRYICNSLTHNNIWIINVGIQNRLGLRIDIVRGGLIGDRTRTRVAEPELAQQCARDRAVVGQDSAVKGYQISFHVQCHGSRARGGGGGGGSTGVPVVGGWCPGGLGGGRGG